MAKKQQLSLDEKLEQAFVKLEEQPYTVPQNWVWTRLGVVAKWGSGGTPSRKISEYYCGDIPWIKTGELNDNYIYDTEEKISIEAIKKSSAKLFPVNSVAVAMYGATIGKVGILGVESTTNQACACAISLKCLYYKYLFFYLLSQKNTFIEKGKGGAQPNISQEIIKVHELPLPPLAEQRRIVTTIESLFAKLDRAKELVQTSLDSFAERKAAILHQAFTGVLIQNEVKNNVEIILREIQKTKERLISEKKIQKPKKIAPIKEDEIPYLLPGGWKFVKLGEIAYVTKLAGFEYTKYINLNGKGQIPVIRAQNVRKGYLRLENLLYIDEETSIQLNRSALYKKCLVMTFIGAGIGDVALFDNDQRYHLAPNVAKIEIYNNKNEKRAISEEYVLYYLLSFFGQQQIFKSMKSTAQPSLSMETIREIIVPIPSSFVQEEIVKCLDILMRGEEKANELCDVIQQIGQMKKAILARAFRGELGTNDPAEESALELLKNVLQEN